MTTCNIPNCDFIQISKNRGTKLHFFQVPKDSNKRSLWQEKVLYEFDFKLSDKNRVCELHFEAKFILRDFVHIINGKEERLPRAKICLTSDAIPTIFPTSNHKVGTEKQSTCETVLSDITNTANQLFKSPNKTKHRLDENSPKRPNQNASPKKTGKSYSKSNIAQSSLNSSLLDLTPTSQNDDVSYTKRSVSKSKSHLEFQPILNSDSTQTLSAYDVSPRVSWAKRVASTSIAQLELESNTKINLTSSTVSASKKKLLSPSNERKLYELYNFRRLVKNKCVRIKKLQLKVKKLTKEIEKLRENDVKIKNLAKRQQLIIKECLSNSLVKSSTGYRYSKEWILDSLLLKIKSTSTYNFLRLNNYLPLPSIPTLNRAVKNLKAEFGFDETLFASLKEKLITLPENERRGTLMFDEIQISKHLDFRPYEGKVIGKVDYGGVEHELHSDRDGDHALVFYFQPLKGGWVQAIGAFCSAGATPAIVLTKLILQAIIHLHQSGAVVDALVSDGASTNRSALTTLGFSCKGSDINNSFQHPCDESRVIYMICDIPHIFKCIRNNILKATRFLVQDGKVELSDFCQLLVADLNKASSLRAAPKLTEAHVNPNNFQKQSVRLATQLFSNSVATAMLFYKELGFPGLQNCTATVNFTRRLNRLFDLLNSRTPRFGNGLRLDNGQIEELEKMLEWLINWEAYYVKLPLPEPSITKEGEKKKKPVRLFLSEQTCAALKRLLE